MWKLLILLLIAVFAPCLVAFPQQQQQSQDDLSGVIDDIFNTQTTTVRPRPRRPGFGDIVTSDPTDIEPTQSPQTFVKSDGERCICVPYYLCDADNKTIITEGSRDGFGVIDIRFDPTSCQEILDVCCNPAKTESTPISPPPVTDRPNRPTGCGIRNVGGLDFTLAGNFNNEAGFGEFPWTVALLKLQNDEYFCSGSLIHPQVILTGSHCVRMRQASEMKVRAGEWDTQTTKERLPFQERGVQRVLTHPEYNPKTLANDFALLVLDQPFQLADHIGVICLPPRNFVSTSRNCFASGWGQDVFGKAGKFSVIQKRVPLPIVPNSQCQNQLRNTRLGSRFNLDPSFICAGGLPGTDTCQGDGGAPLVCPVTDGSQDRYYQVGMVAWGIGCNENYPAAYASVTVGRDWIDQQMAEMGFDTSVYSF